MNKSKHINNLIINNPVAVQGFGLLPVIAVTRNLKEAVLMSVLIIATMLLSSVFISVFKKLIYEKYEYIAFMSIISAFTTLMVLLAQKLFPEITNNIGIYLPLVAVNSLVLYRIRAYAAVQKVGDTVLDSITNGLGFFITMLVVAFIRELLGLGTLFGFRIIPKDFVIPTFTEPMMAFIIVGLLIAFFNWYSRESKLKGAK